MKKDLDKIKKQTIVFITVAILSFVLGKIITTISLVTEIIFLAFVILTIINSIKLMKMKETKTLGIVLLVIAAILLLLFISATLILARI